MNSVEKRKLTLLFVVSPVVCKYGFNHKFQSEAPYNSYR